MKNVHKNLILICLSISLLSFFLFFGTLGCARQYVSSEDRQKIVRITSEEFYLVKDNLDFIAKNKDAVWAQGDFKFYALWLKGLGEEKKGMYADATILYEKAYKIARYETPSYEILLPLGRAYLLDGKRDKALSALERFVKEAESEMSSSRPWELTPEAEQVLLKNTERAEWLINLCK